MIQWDGNADPKVVSAAISISSRKTANNVMVEIDDTDIAIIFQYHWNGEISEIIFNSKKSETAWSMAYACSNLENKEYLLFVHALSGCDTVSVTSGKGKASFPKLMNQSDELKDLSTSINYVWADKDYIGRSSADVFRIM